MSDVIYYEERIKSMVKVKRWYGKKQKKGTLLN